VLDRLSAPTAGIALRLYLLKHAGRQLVLDDPDTVAAAVAAGVDDTIGRATAAALLTDVLLLPLKLGLPAIVEIAQRDANLDLYVVASRLSSLVMPTATKESAEKVEGIMVATTSLLTLFQAVVSVLVVYLAGLGIAEGFVGLGDLDELGLRRVVSSKAWLIEAGKNLGVPSKTARTDSCLGGTFCSAADKLI
jgi:hypothetical protein